MLDVRVDVSDLRRTLEHALPALALGTQKALNELAAAAAKDAKEHHPYTNRTGKLEQFTRVKKRQGDNALLVKIEAARPYASYVEAMPKFRFLGAAVDRATTHAAVEVLAAAAARAMQRSVMRT